MTSIVWPSNTKDIIDDIRSVIGREVEFITIPSSIPCPVCDLDPITDTSTDSFCPTCSGDYWIPIYSGYTILAHVTWGPADFANWQSAGQLFDGDCRLQIEKTDENMAILDITSYVVVDEKRLEIKRRTLRGVPTLNRVILDLIESEKED